MWPFESDSVYPELRPRDVGVQISNTGAAEASATPSYDYIVVGAGTAGCVLASRLSEIAGVSVLVIERGIVKDDTGGRVPAISVNMHRKEAQSIKWDADTDPALNRGELIELIRGQGLGGTSRLNGMLYTRGSCGDYNNWRDMGHPSWSYDALLPYFVKSENSLTQPPSIYRGKSGPWKTGCVRDKTPYKVVRLAAEVSPKLGIPLVPDLNAPSAPANACGYVDQTIDEKCERSSTYHAFLPKKVALDRKAKLKICTDTIVTRLDIRKGDDGKLKAYGVFFEPSSSENETFYAAAKREVILCGGAFGSPQILMLSGVGPAQYLNDVGIDVVHDLQGVGDNLQDQLGIPIQYEVPLNDSVESVMLRENRSLHIKLYIILRIAWELLSYIFTRSGLLSVGVACAAVFARSELLDDKGLPLPATPEDVDPTLPKNIPDIELLLLPFNGSHFPLNSQNGIFTFFTVLLKQKSVGYVRLASNDPRAIPKCDLCFLSNPEDYAPIRKGVKLALRYADSIRANGYPFFKPIMVPETENDEDIDKFIRYSARSSYHYAGTCRMGKLDETKPGVVDDELRVHGISGLRICDASVFPEIPATHTMAPTVVVAEKCADLIKDSFAIATSQNRV